MKAMRTSVLYSSALHVVVIAAGYYVMPALSRPPPLVETPIVVEIVQVADETNAPVEKKVAKKKPQAKPPPPPKVKPPPPKAKAPPPPKAEAPPPPEVAALPPEPLPKPKVKPKPKPEAKPKPKPKPVAKPKPKPPHRLAKVKPKRKPKPPDPFASVLKTVEELKAAPKTALKKDEKKEKKKESFETMMAKALVRNAPRQNPLMPVTISEIDLLRRQIGRCWNLPAGAKDAEDLIIEIRVAMNSDGTVNSARVVDQVRMTADPFFRSAAESALRAVLNKRCQPFKLSPEKYDLWKHMILSFNPKEMFG